MSSSSSSSPSSYKPKKKKEKKKKKKHKKEKKMKKEKNKERKKLAKGQTLGETTSYPGGSQSSTQSPVDASKKSTGNGSFVVLTTEP